MQNMTEQEKINVKKGWRRLLVLAALLIVLPFVAAAILGLCMYAALVFQFPYHLL